MRIVVTGGAGFIGRHLVDRLASEVAGPIIVVDNLHRGRPDHLPASERVVFRRADVRDRAAMLEALQGCELVFHLAAQSNVLGAVENLHYSFTSNVEGTFNVLEAARQAGVRRVVFTSSREVYGDPERLPVQETAPLLPKNAYGASKAAGEMYCRVLCGDGLEVVTLRLANVYGPRDRDRVIPIFMQNALRGEPLTLYGGAQVVDFVWIGIVVEALVCAGFGKQPPGPVNIGSGRGTTISELAARVLELTGSRSAVQVAPSREVEVTRFIADTTRARQWLGIEPPEDPLFRLVDVVKCRSNGTSRYASSPRLAIRADLKAV